MSTYISILHKPALVFVPLWYNKLTLSVVPGETTRRRTTKHRIVTVGTDVTDALQAIMAGETAKVTLKGQQNTRRNGQLVCWQLTIAIWPAAGGFTGQYITRSETSLTYHKTTLLSRHPHCQLT